MQENIEQPDAPQTPRLKRGEKVTVNLYLNCVRCSFMELIQFGWIGDEVPPSHLLPRPALPY